MKKFFAFTLAMLLVLAICASACADVVYLDQTRIPAQAVATVRITGIDGVWKSGNAGRLYVRHYLWSNIEGYYGTNNHTNYFQAFNIDNINGRLSGDWMAPNTANYVRSGSLVTGSLFGVAARANTKYADAGYSTIQVSGYADGHA